MWFDEAIFYQIYPLGFCGAERENDFGIVRHRLSLIEKDIPRLKELGVTAVLFNPLFESERHGYDTADFFHVDRRLGTDEELISLVDALHAAGIRVLFDGVFHHVGRAFPPFLEVKEKRWEAPSRDWFFVDFNGNSRYNDGFSYADWEGHAELVKLNLGNPAVQNYLMDAVRFWIRTFHIDGLRLDVCYSLPAWFLELLRRTVNAEKEDFFLMGETIRLNNFEQNICPARLDSATNYEGARSMLSAFNSGNLFEIEYSMTRLFGEFPWCLFRGKNLFNFADNHDIERAATSLKEKKNLCNLYTLLFTMPGIPCIYYGSEYGAEGDKSDGDYLLRPFIGDIDRGRHPELFFHIKKLATLRREHPALCYGGYKKTYVNNGWFSFERSHERESIVAALNITGGAPLFRAGEGEAVDLLTGERMRLENISLAPYGARVLRKL